MPWYLKLLQHRQTMLMDEELGSEGTGGGGGGSDAGGGGGEDGGDGASEKTKPKITDAEAKLLRENMQKKERIKELDLALKKFEGVDLERYQKFIADEEKRAVEAQEAERKAAEARGDFERVKAQMVELHGKTVSELQSQLADLQKQLGASTTTIDELTVGNAFGQSRFISEKTNLSVSKARTLYGSHFEQQGGRVVGYDKPVGAAERTVLVDANGEPLSFELALTKIVEADPDVDLVMKATIKPGSKSSTVEKGAPSGGNDPGTGRDRIAAALSSVTKKK